VTTRGFLERCGFESPNDLPDIEALEDAGLLGSADHREGLAGLRADLVVADDGAPSEGGTSGPREAKD
jgi:hypothetical protein